MIEWLPVAAGGDIRSGAQSDCELSILPVCLEYPASRQRGGDACASARPHPLGKGRAVESFEIFLWRCWSQAEPATLEVMRPARRGNYSACND